MNDFVRLSEMAAAAKARLNALYDEPHAELIARGLEICGFEPCCDASWISKRIRYCKNFAAWTTMRRDSAS